VAIKQRLLLAAAAVALFPVSAMAQVPSSDQTGGIEEITVTAQKREQKSLDVPMSLTAYNQKFLDSIGVQEFDKLSLFVPGFEVQNQSVNDPGFVMRGITSDSGEATQEPRVSVFQDGVSISKSRGSYVELFDIDRVEIAKGPQSTLFGRGALIGAVNIVEAKADPSAFDWSANGEYGNYNYGLMEGMVNLPIDDTLAVRIAGRYKTRDGYTQNLEGGRDFNSLRTGAARASIAWEPSAKFRADIIANYQRDTPSDTGFKSGTFDPTDPTTGATIGNLKHTSGMAGSAASDFPDGPLGIKRTVWGVTGLATYHLDEDYTLSSISAYRKFDSTEVFDPDGFSLPMLTFAETAKGEQASQEFRVNFDNGGPVSWFSGISYFHDDGLQKVPNEIDEDMALSLLAGQISEPVPQPESYFYSTAYTNTIAPALVQGFLGHYGIAVPLSEAQGIAANLRHNLQEQYTNYSRTNAYDWYGEATWHVTPQFELTGGLRYSIEDKTSAVSSSVLNGARSVLGGVVGATTLAPGATQDLLLYALSLPGAYNAAFLSGLLPQFGIASQPTVNNGDKVSAKESDGAFTWRGVARYSFDDDTNVYASYARGRRPNDFEAQGPALPGGAAVFTDVPSETVDSYEVGAKTLTLDNKLRLDSAVYYYEYNNFQTTVQEGAVLVTANAGKASAYGFEGQADWALADWADFFATYAYSHARFDTGAYKGNQFRLTPDHKVSLGFSLRDHELGGLFTLTPTYTWQSMIFFDDDNDIPALQTDHILPDTKQDELQKQYGLMSARLTYRPDDADWTVGAFVNNVFDQKYIKDAGNTGDTFGIPTFISGEPRFFGVTFSIRK
jgi:outer membrane receptor protein involved in Fe transport